MKPMRPNTSKYFISVLLLAVLSGSVCLPYLNTVAADDKPNYSKKFKVVQAKGSQGKMTDKVLQIIKRPLIPHQPFMAENPETKVAYKADERVVLPDGRSFNAIDYHAQLNMVERGLNSIGRSLREPDDTLVIAQTNPELLAQIERDGNRRIRGAHRRLSGRELERFTYYSDPKKVYSDYQVSPEKAFPGFTSPPVRKAALSQPGSYHTASLLSYSPTGSASPAYDGAGYTSQEIAGLEIGDPQFFSVFLKGKLDASTQAGKGTIGANLSAGASIFSSALEFVSVGGSVETGSNPRGNVYVNVLGFTVYNPEKGVNASVLNNNSSIAEDGFSNPLFWSTEIPFALGPVPMVASFSVQGDVGLGYNYLAVAAGYSHCQLKPYINSSLTATISANLGIAGAGGGVTLELLNDKMDITAFNNSALKAPVVPTTGLPHHRHQLMASNEITALKGKAFAFVWFYVPRCCLPPWKKKHINWTIYESPAGFSASGVLFNKVNTDGDIY